MKIDILNVVSVFITGLHSAVHISAFQGHTQVNFVSTLLRVTMSDQLDLPVRQAGESKLWLVKIVQQSVKGDLI